MDGRYGEGHRDTRSRKASRLEIILVGEPDPNPPGPVAASSDLGETKTTQPQETDRARESERS